MAATARRIIWLLLLISLSSCDSAALPPVAEILPSGQIRVGIDPSLPPFGFLQDGELAGIDVDLAQELGRRIGLPVQFVVLGYDGLYEALVPDHVSVDLVISALIVDPAKTGDVRYTRHYFNNGLVLVSPAENPIATMDQLGGRSLAYEFGSTADSEARAWERRITPFETQPYELPDYALDAVRLGLADAALVDATSARLYLRAYPDWNAAMYTVTDQWYAIAVHISNVDLWKLVNLTLQTIADDGTLDTVLDKWL